MDVGRIEALLTAKFDSDPFDKYERAITGAKSDASKKVTADLDAKPDLAGFGKYDRELDSAQAKAKQGATAKLDTRADTSGADRYKRSLSDVDGRQRTTEKGAKGLSAGWGTLAANAKILAGGAGLAGVAIGARTAYEEQKEAQAVGAQLTAVLKSTGGAANVTAGQVESLSERIAEKAALDDEAVMSGANLLLTFKNIRNESGEGNDIFDRTVKTTADVARAFGKEIPQASIMMGKALNDPIAGISALSRVGIQFSDDQKAVIEKMVEGGDTMGAQKLILKELEEQVGGSARAYSKTLPGAVDRTKNAFNNLMEELGGKAAPAVSKVADALTGLMTGKGLDVGGLGAALAPIADGVRSIWNSVRPIFAGIGAAFRDTFSPQDVRDVKKALSALATAVGAVMRAIGAIIKRASPGIQQVFKGLFTFFRGVVRLIGAVIRGDWQAAWRAAKDIVVGIFTTIFGVLRAWSAPIRELLSRLWEPAKALFGAAFRAAKSVVTSIFGSILDYIRGRVSAAKSAVQAVGRAISSGINVIRDIPGKVRDVISSAVDAVRSFAGNMASAGASIGSAIMSGIMDGINSASGFVADIGDSIRQWINDNTAFGNEIGIGKFTVDLPALAHGGPVGPTAGGPRVFIAGEGNKDEWVISQEGDRSQNIKWAREALEQLTGKPVEMHRKGKKSKAEKKADRKEKRENKYERKTGKKLEGIIGKLPPGWQGGFSSRSDKISRLERKYGQQARTFDFTEEEYLVSHDDGSITIDQTAVDRRVNEIAKLKELRQKVIDAVRDLIQWINESAPPIQKAINAMMKAAGSGKGDSNFSSGYRSKAATYQAGLDEMLRAVPDLEIDIDDHKLDLDELNVELASIAGMGSQVRPPDPVDPDDPGGTVTPEMIAAGVAAEMAAFNTSREELFSSFGQNFIGAGGTVDSLSATAGMTYFGGGQSDGDSMGTLGAAGGGYESPSAGGSAPVNIVNNYAAPPDDPHTWSQGIAWELKTAVG